ncbi:hypothetical protein BGZ93_009805 [Podila epicladia]|nr:hypothetical protein BGZ92_002680 [Podila epicladia]KAG0089538.1 hypothetical protein BGZ93_009805 [Podila epicladia]
MLLKSSFLALTAVLASAHALEATHAEDTNVNDASKLLIFPGGRPYRPIGPYVPMYPGYFPLGHLYPYTPFSGRASNRLMPRRDVINILDEDKKSPKVIIEGHHQDPKLLFGGDQEKILVDHDAGAEELGAEELTAENVSAEDENGESKIWNPYWWYWRRRGPWGPWGPWGGHWRYPRYPPGPWFPYGRRRF